MSHSVYSQTSPSGRVVIVGLIGEHDVATAPAIRDAMLDAERRAGLVVLDFAATTFMDSTVLGVIAGAWRRARADGRELIGVRASGMVAKALSITSMDDMLAMSTELDPEVAAMLAG